MKTKKTLILASLLVIGASSLTAGLSNISYGSAVAAGGAQFYGSDAGAADSIAIGYFAGDVVDAEGLTGWTQYASNSVFAVGAWNNPSALSNVDTTAAEGLTAYLLITDGALQALVRVNSWADISGADAPASPTALSYRIGAADTAAGITGIAASNTLLTILNGGGTDFVGGTSGTGVSFTLAAVPEPSAFAALAGVMALGFVALRRRRA